MIIEIHRVIQNYSSFKKQEVTKCETDDYINYINKRL